MKPRQGKNAGKDSAWGYFFISPLLLGVIVFSIGPVLYAFYMALTEWDGLTKPVFIGFRNFIAMAGDAQVGREFLNTVQYMIGTVPIGLCIAIFVAVLLNSGIRGKAFFRVAFFLPVVTMPVAIAAVWRFLFNSQYGLVNYLFRPFGLNPQWLGDPRYIMPALITVAIWAGIGYNAIILLAGLQQIPKTYYEAADIDGAGPFRRFFRITIPLLSPTVFFLLITSMIGAFKAFDLIYLFAGATANASGAPTTEAIKTMVFGIYQKGFNLLRMGYAASEAVVLFAIILIVTLIQFRLQKRFVFYD
ncbi:MAG: sugar ABC transporter permease [Treponema sp.]|nr:sugar ABC transporter permease [Treponema sp.]